MEERLNREAKELQDQLQEEFDDPKIKVRWDIMNEAVHLVIMYGGNSDRTNVTAIAAVDWDWNDEEWNDEEFEFVIYNPDGWPINTGTIQLNEIPDHYPYSEVVRKYNLLQSEKEFKRYKKNMDRILTTLSTQLLGYKVEEPELLINKLLNKYKR
ncbi:Hypothetical protein ORPV_719 [Orpheovirus IHUMI-LCC2]|uniref:Uncharacterized protein n=1 Tax=Orpheovirus IHUMI-LCC2 TaxID=2023057 RepID=A0A2I2L512_9VIRU|nr:Hypothetical protein ORPV_719 [Orpheovirus IHUMI-LCC2]SNW62623.1 Hypothetical protein ORPV_719 [Orpheovirus IHUMI-LCC2]